MDALTKLTFEETTDTLFTPDLKKDFETQPHQTQDLRILKLHLQARIALFRALEGTAAAGFFEYLSKNGYTNPTNFSDQVPDYTPSKYDISDETRAQIESLYANAKNPGFKGRWTFGLLEAKLLEYVTKPNVAEKAKLPYQKFPKALRKAASDFNLKKYRKRTGWDWVENIGLGKLLKPNINFLEIAQAAELVEFFQKHVIPGLYQGFNHYYTTQSNKIFKKLEEAREKLKKAQDLDAKSGGTIKADYIRNTHFPKVVEMAAQLVATRDEFMHNIYAIEQAISAIEEAEKEAQEIIQHRKERAEFNEEESLGSEFDENYDYYDTIGRSQGKLREALLSIDNLASMV